MSERPSDHPIPREFYSEYEERPFRCCTRCGEGLHDFEGGYKVTKIYRQDEVILEHALCSACVERMMEESSEESLRRLNEFHEERLREGVEGTQDCALCTSTRATMTRKEFAVVAICVGLDLVESHLICIDCMEEMNSLVSEETRREWNRFVEENFPGVPADFVPAPSSDSPSPIPT